MRLNQNFQRVGGFKPKKHLWWGGGDGYFLEPHGGTPLSIIVTQSILLHNFHERWLLVNGSAVF